MLLKKPCRAFYDDRSGHCHDNTAKATQTLFSYFSSENETDQTAALEHGDKWIVGRDPSCEICVEDINISRQHFHITKKDDTYFITDLGSSNGTYVDDQLLKPRQPSPLKSGAVISVLEIEMYFEIRNPKVEKQITNLPAPIAENAPCISAK